MSTRPRIVAKLGGSPIQSSEQLAHITQSLARLANHHDIVVVHGGGPQATALSKRLGLTPNMVGGRRVTDSETLEVMKMVLAGQINVDLTNALRAAGMDAVGVSGVSGVIRAVKRPPRVVSGGGDEPVDFGHVGDIVDIGSALLVHLLSGGFTPVLNSLGADELGRPYNINADIAATRIARALRAEHLLLLTGGVPGVLRDRHDPESRIPQLTVAEGRAAIADGTIQGGMIPKLEESFKVLGQGVGAIHILGALGSGDLERAVDAPGALGTVLLP